MGKNKKIDENITRRGYNWLENYLMQMIEASYEELKKGETTLLDICKGAVDTARHNHVHYNTREDRMQIYQMAKECLTRVEDYMASQEGMTDDNMFPPHTDGDNPYESKNMKNTVRITESQLKQMITESVKRVINESIKAADPMNAVSREVAEKNGFTEEYGGIDGGFELWQGPLPKDESERVALLRRLGIKRFTSQNFMNNTCRITVDPSGKIAKVTSRQSNSSQSKTFLRRVAQAIENGIIDCDKAEECK